MHLLLIIGVVAVILALAYFLPKDLDAPPSYFEQEYDVIDATVVLNNNAEIKLTFETLILDFNDQGFPYVVDCDISFNQYMQHCRETGLIKQGSGYVPYSMVQRIDINKRTIKGSELRHM